MSIGGQDLRTLLSKRNIAISAAWYALAIQDEEIGRLLAKWNEPAPVQVPAEILAIPISAMSISVSRDPIQHGA
jgi:hypothetical protein